ncbi:MAG: pilus assembly protein TadG-related protein, partial [Candidatus Brocadiia bacterium]
MISILEKLRELRREEDGQSIVFGVISIFLVLMFGAMVLGVGRVATRRIQMQFAADSAAYSAATMESDCLNAIALLNSTMARTRARTLRYVSDVNMYGVLAELRDKVTEAGGEQTADDLGTAINDLETELEDIDDEDERAYLEGKVDRLRRQRNRLYEDQDPEEGDIYEITDPEFWEQQVEELETQIEDVEEEIDDASGDIRDRLEEDLSRLEEQLELAEDRLDGGSDGSGSPSWIEEIVGMESPHVEYGARTEDGYDFDGAYARAERWVPAAEEWIKEMSRLSHSIATLAPYLSRETAYRVARKNGAEYVSIFPASRWMPREDDDRAVQVYNDTDPEKWRVEGGGEFIEVEQKPCGSFDICPPGTLDCEEVENCWRVAWGHGASIDSEYIICELEDRKWTVYSPETNCWEQVRAIQQREEVYTTTYGPEGVDVIRHGTDEGYDPPVLELVSEQGDVPDNTLFVRRVDA